VPYAATELIDRAATLGYDALAITLLPHPFFPAPTCLLGYLDRYASLFDAVELNAMYTASVNFNRRAARWAARHGKPLVGNGDVHRLRQLGTTYSLVDAAPDPDAICAAIVAGRVRVESRPLAWGDAACIMAALLLGDDVPRWRTEKLALPDAPDQDVLTRGV
jgi:hypothetical protein